MVLTTRILFGLDETFVLLPYIRGAKRSRLVIRARYLKKLEQYPVAPSAITIVEIKVPLIVGELLNPPISAPYLSPVVMSGSDVARLRGPGVAWARRYHRVLLSPQRSVCFESGTKHVFATTTSYYDLGALHALVKRYAQASPRLGGG